MNNNNLMFYKCFAISTPFTMRILYWMRICTESLGLTCLVYVAPFDDSFKTIFPIPFIAKPFSDGIHLVNHQILWGPPL